MSNPFRFDLGTALAAWRRALAHNRAFSADDLDELEQHLRDHVAALCAQGLDEEAAYRRALAEMGDCGTAEVEYRKVYWAKARHQRRLGEELTWRMAMIKNYVQTALRSLLRQKGYAFINLAGLTLGMTCCLVLLQYVAFEYSFDAFNTDAPQLYRITKETRQNDPTPNLSAFTEWKLGPTLADEVPEIARFTRIHPNYGDAVVSTTGATQNRKTFEEHTLLYVDPAFLSMFTYPLVTGDPEAALTQPRTLLLSETAARKYFGTLDAVGEMLDVTGFVRGSYTVAGVFRDVPAASHLKFDFLLPMADLLQSDQ
jgi:hypothetical protein